MFVLPALYCLLAGDHREREQPYEQALPA